MLYAILCYDNEAVTSSWSKEKDDEVMASLGAVQATISAQGRLGPVARLLPTTAATTIRKGKEPIIMDGPFAETKEILGGYYIIDVADLDAALDWAAKIPSAPYGSTEVRPVWVFDQEEAGASQSGAQA